MMPRAAGARQARVQTVSQGRHDAADRKLVGLDPALPEAPYERFLGHGTTLHEPEQRGREADAHGGPDGPPTPLSASLGPTVVIYDATPSAHA